MAYFYRPYLAQIQYEFFYQKAHEAKYRDDSKRCIFKGRSRVINDNFIRLYINKTWVGEPDNQVQIDGESLIKFDFQFLDAIRDVERDMFSGKNTLLKNVDDLPSIMTLNLIKVLQMRNNLNR